MEPMWCDVRRHYCRCEERCDDIELWDDDTEDRRLDDPRHGQAEYINRMNRDTRSS